MDNEVARREQPGGVLTMPQKMHATAQSERRDLRLQRSAQRTFAEDGEIDFGELGDDACERAQEELLAFRASGDFRGSG